MKEVWPICVDDGALVADEKSNETAAETSASPIHTHAQFGIGQPTLSPPFGCAVPYRSTPITLAAFPPGKRDSQGWTTAYHIYGRSGTHSACYILHSAVEDGYFIPTLPARYMVLGTWVVADSEFERSTRLTNPKERSPWTAP